MRLIVNESNEVLRIEVDNTLTDRQALFVKVLRDIGTFANDPQIYINGTKYTINDVIDKSPLEDDELKKICLHHYQCGAKLMKKDNKSRIIFNV